VLGCESCLRAWLLGSTPRTAHLAASGSSRSKTETRSAAAAAPTDACATVQANTLETAGAATHADATAHAAATQANATDTQADATAAHADATADAPDSPGTPRSLFDFLGYDELREVVDFLEGIDLRLLRDAGVVSSPHSGLIKKWTSRWTRNAALNQAFAFLEPGDLGTLVAAFFVSDVALASAAHTASTTAVRAGRRRRVPLAAATEITVV